MPKVSTKKAIKPKKAKLNVKQPVPVGGPVANGNGIPADAAPDMMELQPPTKPVEAREEEETAATPAPAGEGRDVIATSLNIAKLQAMSMTELNHMAKDLGVENFGTMRKHEVIFHILQKNAERSGVAFSEG